MTLGCRCLRVYGALSGFEFGAAGSPGRVLMADRARVRPTIAGLALPGGVQADAAVRRPSGPRGRRGRCLGQVAETGPEYRVRVAYAVWVGTQLGGELARRPPGRQRCRSG